MKDDEIIFQFAEGALNNLNAISAQLQNQILEAYNVEAVRMFARLHATDETTGAFDVNVYNDYIRDYGKSNEYNRYTFNNKREAENFAQQLRNQSNNNNIVVAPVSLNGKYFVETKGAVEMKDENGAVHKITNADTVSRLYEQQTNFKAKVYTSSDNYTSTYENAQAGTVEYDIFSSAIDNEQDKDVIKLQRKIKRFNQEITKYAERSNAKHILHSNTKRDAMGKEVFNERTGTGVRTSSGKVGDKTVEHQATVVNFLNNRMVIVDGKLVTDSKKVEKIQKLHQKRMTAVEKASDKIDKTNKRVGKIFYNDENAITERKNHKFLFSREQIKMQINAEGVKERRIKQNYYSHTTYSSYDSSVLDSFRNNLGREQIIMSNLETSIIVDKSSLDAIKNYRTSRDYNKQVFTDFKSPKFSKREEETLQKILKLSERQTEATFVLELSAEDRINLNSMARKTESYGKAYLNHSSSSSVPVSIAEIESLKHIQEHTDIKTGINDISHAFEGGLSTYKQITNLYEDLGIDLRFGEIEGKTLSSQQLMFGTDSRVLRFLEKKGVVYNAKEGKFVYKATGDSLNKSELEEVFKTVNTDSNIVSGFKEIGNQIKNNTNINSKLFENISNAFNTNDVKNFFGDESGLDKALAQTTYGQEHGKSAMDFFEKSGEQYGFKIADDGKIIHHREKLEITRYDVLQIDKAFLLKMATPVTDKDGVLHSGIMLVKGGKIDIKAIRNLSKEELALRGISESTRNMVVKLHTDANGKYVEWDKFKGFDWGKIAQRVSQLTDNDKEVAEVIKMTKTYASVPEKVTSVMKVTKQFEASAKLSVDRLKMKMESKGIKLPETSLKKPKKPKEKKPPQKTNNNITKSDDFKKIERRIAKEEKQIKRIERSEKRLKFLKKFDVVTRVKEKFAETLVGQFIADVSSFVKNFTRKLAIKFVVVFGQVYLMMAGFLVVSVAVLSIIENLTGLPRKGLMAVANLISEVKGEEVVMIELYNALQEKQDKWINVSDNASKLFSKKEGLKYSLNYVGYEDYIKSTDGLVLVDDVLYIDPYYTIGTTAEDIEARKNHLIEVDKFAGANKYSLVANPSVYTAINNDVDETGNIISAESGHTSNIKDILAMTDVMYAYNMVECSDGSLASIFSVEPAVLNTNAYYNKAVNGISWAIDYGKDLVDEVWKWWCSGGEDTVDVEPFKIDWGEEVSYDTVLNYVTFLWDSSHQNQYDLSLDNFPQKHIVVNGEVIDEETEISREQASLLQTNINKREDNYDLTSQIDTSNGNLVIYPFVQNASGTKMRVTVDAILRKITPVENNWCLFNKNEHSIKMGSNATTLDFIRDNMENGSQCWELPDENISKLNHGLTATSDWKSTEDEAIEDVKNKIDALINENLATSEFQEKYYMNGEDNFTYTHFENNFSSRELTNSTLETKQDVAYKKDLPVEFWADYYEGSYWETQDWQNWLNERDFDFDYYNNKDTDIKDAVYPLAPRAFMEYDLKDEKGNILCTKTINASFGKKTDGSNWFSIDNETYSETGLEVTYTFDGVTNTIDLVSEDGTEVRNYERRLVYADVSEQTIYKPTEYKAIGTVDNAIVEVQENYIRDCKGDGYDNEGNSYTDEKHLHKFSFYAPEVGIKSKGIVYSISNEQLAMSGMYNGELECPKALDFNLAEKGYSDMQGHYIGTDNGAINYNTPSEAVATSHCELPSITNPQGSVTGNKGLNLLLDGDGAWVTSSGFKNDMNDAIKPKDGISPFLLKDIFDIDCLLDKASNVFCCEELSDYEGWSADNKTIATLKTSIDWNEVYDFDIPLEVGCPSLSPDDIEWLNNALKIQYGDDYTEEKQEVMNLLFKWVGRGHFSDAHNSHDFLSQACGDVSSTVMINGVEHSDKFQVSCTAGDSVGFANFIRNAFGKDTFIRKSSSGDTGNLSSYTDLKPCDILHQIPNINLNDVVAGSEEDTLSAIIDTLMNKNNINSVSNLMQEVCAFYVGTFTNDEIFADCEDGETKTLLNGFVIKKGVPVTIGMDNLVKKTDNNNNGSGCGTVFLRSKNLNSSEDYIDTNKWTNKTNYFWLIYPNSKTYYRRW